MEIETTELEPCKFAVKCSANVLEIMDARTQVLQQFKKAPVPGNREGKASLEAIKMHYRKQIDESVKRALAESSLHETLFEKKLKPYGAPTFKSLFMDAGKFTCEFELFTKPEFDLPDWKSLEIPKPHEPHSTIEIAEKLMQEIRVNYGDAVPYGDDDFVQDGDNVIVSYEAIVDGIKVESLCAENELITIGKGPIDNFDSNMLGMKMGDTREFDYQAPASGLPSLAGKMVHFKVIVSTGSKITPAPLNDELAVKIGKKDFKELQDVVGQMSFARVENYNRAKLNEAISNKLVEITTIKVPGFMALSEAQYLAQQSKLDWNTMIDSDRERFVQMAEKNVSLSLILDIIRENTPEAQLTDQEVFDFVKQNLMQNAKPGANLDEAIQQMNKSGYLQLLMNRIRDEYTLAHMIKTIKIVE
jgi:trigger factor